MENTDPPSHHKNKRCSLTMKDLLSFISSLLLPLMLLVFTFVMYFHQQNIAAQQRLEDRYIAREQREQDLNISRVQRLEDRQLAYEQREQDKLLARLQHEDDDARRIQDLNISQIQRQQDKQIADNKLQQDIALADLQRNISLLQRDHQLHRETERYRDTLFIGYIQEMTELLTRHNGTFNNDQVITALARVKTLTTIRQLDSKRNSRLIQFLYAVDLLNNRHNLPPLDLSGAELNGIDLSSSVQHVKMHGLHLVGAYLNDSSFVGLDMNGANFSLAHLARTHFANTILTKADFSFAIFHNADFYATNASQANFNSIRMSEGM